MTTDRAEECLPCHRPDVPTCSNDACNATYVSSIDHWNNSVDSPLAGLHKEGKQNKQGDGSIQVGHVAKDKQEEAFSKDAEKEDQETPPNSGTIKGVVADNPADGSGKQIAETKEAGNHVGSVDGN